MPSGGEGETASVKLGLMVEKAGSARLATLYGDRKLTKRNVGFPFFLLFIWSRALTHGIAQDTSKVNLPSSVFLGNAPQAQSEVSLLGGCCQ